MIAFTCLRHEGVMRCLYPRGGDGGDGDVCGDGDDGDICGDDDGDEW